jgi:hypothetical protein
MEIKKAQDKGRSPAKQPNRPKTARKIKRDAGQTSRKAGLIRLNSAYADFRLRNFTAGFKC